MGCSLEQAYLPIDLIYKDELLKYLIKYLMEYLIPLELTYCNQAGCIRDLL